MFVLCVVQAEVSATSPGEIVGSNPTGGHGCLYFVFVLCVVQLEVSVTSHGETMGSNPTREQGMSLFCLCCAGRGLCDLAW